MSRVVAVLVAAGLIVAAILVRGALDDDDTSGGRSGSDVLRVVCADEIYAACASLDPSRYSVRRQEAPETAAALTSDDAVDFDVWIAPASWPAIVDDARGRAGEAARFDVDATPVARSPLVAVGGDAIASCDWKCIGSATFSIGGAAPSSGLGTLQLGAAASGYFGTASFATNDFDSAFRSWFGGLTERITTNDQPVTTLLQSRAFFDVALSFEADAQGELDAASEDRKRGLTLQYPAPVAYLDVVAVDIDPDRSREAAGVARTVGALLLANGWQEPAAEPDGLPKPGVLTALRELV
jgi:hypothetical protein